MCSTSRLRMAVLRRTWSQEHAADARDSRLKKDELELQDLTRAINADLAIGAEAKSMLKPLTSDLEGYRRPTTELEALVKPHAISDIEVCLNCAPYLDANKLSEDWRQALQWELLEAGCG